MKAVKLAPSILAADFTRLGDQVQAALDAGADHIHVDVMDGRFVPNISIGPLIVRALRPLVEPSPALLDVHLMIVEPDRYVAHFAEAGADIITVHQEATPHLHRTVQAIRALGVRPGVAVNPATPLGLLEEIMPDIDLLLIMSVNPGFGGQTYIPATSHKLSRARAMLAASNPTAALEVDGGVYAHNIADIAAAGADVIVAGSAVFGSGRSVAANMAALRTALMTPTHN